MTDTCLQVVNFFGPVPLCDWIPERNYGGSAVAGLDWDLASFRVIIWLRMCFPIRSFYSLSTENESP